MEQAALALGAALIAFGVYTIANPSEGTVFHPVTPGPGRGPGFGIFRREYEVEHVSTGRSQVYGCLAVVMGAGICWVVLSRR
jgi:hypothetical protein